MGGSQGIVAVLFENTHPAFLRLREGASPQESVVVMDAGPPKDDPLAVNRQALFPPGQCANAEGLLRYVLSEGGTAHIEGWTVTVP